MSMRDWNPDKKLSSPTSGLARLRLSLAFSGPRVKNALRPFLAPTVILAALGIAIHLAWSAAFAAPDGNLHLTFLDVGSADAVLIQTPGGRSVLVDGGASPSQLSGALGQRLRLFDRCLDWLVVASTAEQEVAALPHIMDRFPAADVLWAGPIAGSYAAEQLASWLSANSIPLTKARRKAPGFSHGDKRRAALCTGS
jgi:beta-lactamase superfamily II metal-dependent hydrolase